MCLQVTCHVFTGDVSCRVLANSSVVCVTQSEFIDWQAEKRRLDSMIDHFSAQLAKLKVCGVLAQR